MEDEIKIMLVEPDVRTREVYCEVVAGQKGMKLVFATDQQVQAVDYLRAQEVDVVIMEMELAEGDGIGLTSQATLGYMRMHGVDLVYHKMNLDYSPVHILQMIARLYPYRFCAEPADESATLAGQFRKEMSTYVLRRQVQTELEQMGFRNCSRSELDLSGAGESLAYDRGACRACDEVGDRVRVCEGKHCAAAPTLYISL